MGRRYAAIAARIAAAVAAQLLAADRRQMSNRGGVHVFRPTLTKADKADPSKRVLLTSPHYAYRFQYRKKPYQKGGFKTAGAARIEGERRKEEVRAGLEEDWRKFTVLGLYQLHAARKVQWDESTQKAFEFTWKRLRAKLPDQTLVVDVDDTLLLRLVGEWKAEGYSANTIRVNLKRLREAMQLAHSKRRLPWLPAFPKVKPERREQTVHPVELAQIAAAMPRCFALFLEAAEETGWRARSELQTRKWTHVDWGPERYLCDACGKGPEAGDECSHCRAGRPGWLELDAAACKTDKGRAFPMTRRLRSILTRARLRVEEIQRRTARIVEWVFCSDDGDQLPEYHHAWQAALKKLGIGKLPGRTGPWSSRVVMHDARRTRIRALKKLGVEKETRKTLVGHTSDSAHEGYLERGPDADALRATALQLDRLRDAEAREEPKVEQLALWRKN